MNFPLCVSSLVIASIVYGIVNIYAQKKQQTLAFLKKGFAFSSVVFALIALEIGGSMMLGTCEEGYSSGLYGLLYVVGISIGFLLLGFGFAAKMKAMNVENTIDLFEIKYRSPLIRTSASILSIITTWGLLLGQIVAAKSLVHALGIQSNIVFIALSLFVIIYAVLGGLKAAGLTYSAQLAYTIVVFGGIFGFCLLKEPPSFFSDVFLNQSLFSGSSSITFASIFGSLIMPALYYLTDQEFARPLFAISSKTEAALSAISASIFMLFFSLVPIYFGIKAKAMNLIIADDMSPLIPVLQLLTNDFIVALAVCGMAAALIAMIDYYLWSVSLSITHEMHLAYPTLKHNERLDKSMVILVGIIATLASYCTTSNAIQVLLYSYELYDSCLIVPLLMSYFQTDLKKGSAIGAFLSGLSGFVIFRIIPIPIPGHIASLALSFMGFYLGGILETIIRRLPVFKRSSTCSV